MTSVKFAKDRNLILNAKLLYSSTQALELVLILMTLKFPIRFSFFSPFIILHRLVPLLDHDLFKIKNLLVKLTVPESSLG